MNHRDETKVTYLCRRCDKPYFQVDREKWGLDINKWDRKAKYVLFNKHKCFQKKETKDVTQRS